MSDTLLIRILPGEVDRERILTTHAEMRSELASWAGTKDVVYDPGNSLPLLATALRDYEALEPGEARCRRVLDDRHDAGDEPEALAAARDRVARLTNDLEWFAPDFLTRIQAAKSQTRGCPHCGSQVAVRYVKVRDDRDGTPPTVDCPVCGTRDFCLPPGDRTRKEGLYLKLAEAEVQLTATALREAKRRNNVLWLLCARPPASPPATDGSPRDA